MSITELLTQVAITLAVVALYHLWVSRKNRAHARSRSFFFLHFPPLRRPRHNGKNLRPPSLPLSSCRRSLACGKGDAARNPRRHRGRRLGRPGTRSPGGFRPAIALSGNQRLGVGRPHETVHVPQGPITFLPTKSMIKKLRVTVDGKSYDVTVEIPDEPGAVSSARHRRLPSARPPCRRSRPAPSPGTAPPAPERLPSPMAGRVIAILVKPGQQVKEGDPMLTVEAMKMNTVRPRSQSGPGRRNSDHGRRCRRGRPGPGAHPGIANHDFARPTAGGPFFVRAGVSMRSRSPTRPIFSPPHLSAWEAVRADRQTGRPGAFSARLGFRPGRFVALRRRSNRTQRRRRARLAPGGRPGRLRRPSSIGLKQFRLRWPNDVLVDDRKLAGLLLDQFVPGLAVAGIGINVFNDPSSTIPP